jgi:outer membrane protein assembly factor BamB
VRSSSDASTGEVEWSVKRDLQQQSAVDGDEAVDGGQTVVALTEETLLVHVEFGGFADDRVEARDPATGDVRWTYADDGDEPVSFGRPVVAGDRVFLTTVTDQRGEGWPSGALRTLSLSDGTERERVPLDAPSFVGPVVAGERCFVVTSPAFLSTRAP